METFTFASVYEALIFFFTFFVFAGVLNGIAFRKGFFAFSEKKSNSIGLIHLISAFFIVFFVQFLFVFLELKLRLVDVEVYLNLIALWGIGLILLLYLYFLNKRVKRQIFGVTPWNTKLLYIFYGMGTWFLCFPWILTIATGIETVFIYYQIPLKGEQLALIFLEQALEDPLLFFFAAITTIFIVPFIEELVFRGFLQSWISKWVNSSYAVVLTSMIFMLFHYSSDQENANVFILPVIFLLSLYLGHLFRKFRSLWASFGLHVAFNAFSTIILWMQS